MKLFSSSLFRVASLALALPILGMCDSYTVNVTGTTLSSGTTSGSPSSSFTLANGDSYSVSVPYYSAFSTETVDYYPTVTYTGTTPLPGASGYDSITIDYFQTFTGNGTFDGPYTETIPLVLGSYETASGYLMVGTTALPTISLSGPGSYTGTATEDVTGLPYGSVTEEYSITCDFFAGAASGSSCSSPSSSTPEPAQMIPAALSLAGFALVALRRRKQ